MDAKGGPGENRKELAETDGRLPVLRFGPFVFDPRRQELSRHGHRVALPTSQMRLLILFVERRNELVTRDEIAARLWSETGTIDVAAGINTAINRLRRNLRVAPGAASAIETVIGFGYRFVPEVTGPGLTDDTTVQTEPLEEASREEAPGEEAVPEASRNPLSFGSEHAALEEEPQAMEHEPGSGHIGPLPAPVVSTPAWQTWRWLAPLALCGLILLTALGFRAVQRMPAPIVSTPEASAAGPLKVAPLHQLTAEYEVGQLTAAAVSPSGQFLAYADPYGISVYSFASLKTHLLAPRPAFTIDRLSWAPDERSLLMSGTDQALHQQQAWYVPLGGDAGLVLADASRAVLSPDGSAMVFTRAENRELWQAAATGRQPRLLRTAVAGERFGLVLWSPAGDRLLATVHSERHTATEGGPAESGSESAYEYLDAPTGRLLHRQDGFAAVSGYLLRNGSFFFIDKTKPSADPGLMSVMMVPLDLGSGHLLGTPHRVRDLEAQQAESISASLTGARTAALLQKDDVDGFMADLQQPGPDLSHVTRLTQGLQQVFPHSWTADGKAILVEGDPEMNRMDGPARAIYLQSIDGARPVLLASLSGAAAMAQLSPDGRWVLFIEFSRATRRVAGIFRVPVDGGKVEQIPTRGDIEEFRCSISTAGRCVVREAVGNEEFAYYDLDPDKGMGEQLRRTAWQSSLFGDWGLSADGKTVAVASHDALHPHIRLFRLGKESSPVQKIAVEGHGIVFAVNWAADGKSLFAECHTKTGYELISLDLNGRARVLRKSSTAIWAVPSRDGRKIAFPGPTSSSSLWASSEGS